MKVILKLRQQMMWGNRFLRFRDRHLLTQALLAEAMGISRRTVQWIETGRHNVSIPVRKKFVALEQKYRKAKDFK